MPESEAPEKEESGELPRNPVREEFFAAAESPARHLEEQEKEERRRRQSIAKITSALGVILSIVATLGGVLGLFSSGLSRAKLEDRTDESRVVIAALQKQVRELDAKVTIAEQRLKQLPRPLKALAPPRVTRR